jgi:hypothetical protein
METAVAANSALEMPFFNVIYADRDGHILYVFGGQQPERQGGDWGKYAGILDGSDPSLLWTSTFAWSELPTGIGGGYIANFGNISDGILTNFSLDQNFAFVLQAGADLMLTPNWGVYVDGKKEFLSTDAQGFVPTAAGPVPVRAHVTLDPWRAAAGITFKY